MKKTFDKYLGLPYDNFIAIKYENRGIYHETD